MVDNAKLGTAMLLASEANETLYSGVNLKIGDTCY